jgi:virginiamycin B lyase
VLNAEDPDSCSGLRKCNSNGQCVDRFREFTVPGKPPLALLGIVTAADGNLWFANGDEVVRITPDGHMTPFPAGRGVRTLTTGPGGTIWFTESDANRIGRMQTTGSPNAIGTFMDFPLSGRIGAGTAITQGPNGTIWFTEGGSNGVGVISPTGEITEHALPAEDAEPFGIAAYGNGDMWLIERAGNQIAQVTAEGTIVQRFPLPHPSSGSDFMILGPDNAFWFGEFSGNRIGRFTTFGKITEFTIPSADSGPSDLVLGPDGNIWFTEFNSNNIGRITPAGAITEFKIPTPNATPFGITVGPDGNLWFTELAGKVGRFMP